uniref:Uncharacterized protein tioL n=1 Tax=Micromonospora sp. ML1 TaxID=349725 RepID=Q333V4_9ACTN|nr:hypothetical protein [Micromonospora sp. ML1]
MTGVRTLTVVAILALTATSHQVEPVAASGDVLGVATLADTQTTHALIANPHLRGTGSTSSGPGGAPAEALSRFHDLGSLAGPGTPSEATDLNDRGDVVGVTSLPGTQTAHAFIANPRHKGGRLIEITPSQAGSSRAQAINRFGVVAGTLGLGIGPPTPAPDGSQPLLQPFVWEARTGLDVLPLPPGAGGAQAVDINDKGTVLVVGTNATGVGLPVGSYLWNPASRTYTTLPPPTTSVTGPVALAHTLDERGGVAGGLVTQVGEQSWHHTAVVWQPGTLAVQQLPTGGSADTYATDRNENGLIVGWRINATGQSTTAIYWPSANAQPVELPGRVAYRVNDAGQIVGIRNFTGSSAYPFSAVMWEPRRGRTTRLGDNDLGSYVIAVNASGRSAGFAVATRNGNNHNTAGWWGPPRRGDCPRHCSPR